MLVRTWMEQAGPQEANVHLIVCTETREAALIDAGHFTPEMAEDLERLDIKITKILLTHGHFDHVDALGEIQAKYPVPVYALQRHGDPCILVKEGDEISVGNLLARVVVTTGHTADSISFIFGDEIVFSGDCLFAGAIGGTSSDELRQQEIDHVRSKLLTLPESCEVRSGHGPTTTVKIERAANPFFN